MENIMAKKKPIISYVGGVRRGKEIISQPVKVTHGEIKRAKKRKRK
jgi:hypothetical protein